MSEGRTGSRCIEIVEVSPRDGLQNEAVLFSTAKKVELIHQAVAAGARRIEVASFVRADRVPQMADAEAVVAALDLPGDVITIGLVLNKRGLLRALDTQIGEIGVVCVASDGFGQRNQGQTSAESVASAVDVLHFARAQGRRAQVTIGVAFGCPFEGEVPPDRVIAIAETLAQAQPIEIAVADTIGVAVPAQVGAMVERLRTALPEMPVRVHLHDTRGTGIANAWAAIEAGAVTLDSSIGGIGGCPFAPGASGNIATESLLYVLERSGISSGYDFDATIAAGRWLSTQMGRPMPAGVGRAGGFPKGMT